MANDYYTEDFQGLPGQTARAESVQNEFSSVATAFDAVEKDTNAAIKATVGETLSRLPGASSRANHYLYFDADGNPKVVPSPLHPRGAWTAATEYAVGDAYTASPNGTLYYVTTAYTSGATFGTTDTDNTSVLVDLSGLFFLNNQITTGPTVSAKAGESYLVNASGGSVTINLPTDAAVGDSPINVTYLAGSLSTGQKITVSSGTLKIMGDTETQVDMDQVNFSATFMYAGTPYGWRLRTLG